jgi:peptidoglycan/xylan/chitin deacetylase (PgdA/CDA1 family)
MSVILGLKVDVCTYDGLRLGVPNLLRLFRRHGVRASFFVALGPDTTGRAIVRAFRTGFLSKLRRTQALRTYGIRTILSGTLLPSRHVGRRLAPVLREILAAGHELAIHGYDHRRWQDRVTRMDEGSIQDELRRAVEIYREVAGREPRGFGAPGWQLSSASLQLLEKLDLAYASDTRGTQPFYPRIHGRTLRTLQLPTTLPTLDEVLGMNGVDAGGYADLVRRRVAGSPWNVLTLHAEMEGSRFLNAADRLLQMLQEARAACIPLEVLADRVRAERGEGIPAAEIVLRPIRGRAGTVAMPGGLEVD